jgi:hypothetical protein
VTQGQGHGGRAVFEAADASFELLLRAEVEGAQPDFFQVESAVIVDARRRTRRQAAEATVKVGPARSGGSPSANRPVNAGPRCAPLGTAYPELLLGSIDYRVSHRRRPRHRRRDPGVVETSDGVTSWETVGVHANIEASWEALLDAVTYGLLRLAAPCGGHPVQSQASPALSVPTTPGRPPAPPDQVGAAAEQPTPTTRAIYGTAPEQPRAGHEQPGGGGKKPTGTIAQGDAAAAVGGTPALDGRLGRAGRGAVMTAAWPKNLRCYREVHHRRRSGVRRRRGRRRRGPDDPADGGPPVRAVPLVGDEVPWTRGGCCTGAAQQGGAVGRNYAEHARRWRQYRPDQSRSSRSSSLRRR